MSADPLTVHVLGGDLNLYAYVSGKALKAVDPLGLCNPAETSCEATASTPEGGVQYGGGHDTTIVRHTQGAGPARTQPRAAASGKTHDLIPGGAAPSELAQLGAEPSEYNASVTDAEARKSNLDPAITVAGAVGEVLGGDGLDFAEMVDPRSSTRDRVIAGGSLAVGIGPLPNLARIRKFFKSSESEHLIRYGSEVEAKAAKGTQQLAPKPGHTTDKRVADWNADIKPQKLGAAKQYSHRMDIEVEQGTRDWLKQWEIEGEPGRYAVPFERIGELNARIRTIMVEKVRKVR